MGRSSGRSPEQTRRRILAAAAAAVRTHGPTATLDDIAQEAGVSKGGLLYHFASKDDLIRALAADLLGAMRESIYAQLDPDDTAPGRLTRAYLRASMNLDGSGDAVDDLVLTAQLVTNPQVAELMRAEAERWNSELRADGLPEDVLAVVIAAADGVSSAPIWAGVTPSKARLEQQLLALTRSPEVWARVTDR